MKFENKFDNYFNRLVEELNAITEEDIYKDLMLNDVGESKFNWNLCDKVLDKIKEKYSGKQLTKATPDTYYEEGEDATYDVPDEYEFDEIFKTYFIEEFLEANNLNREHITDSALDYIADNIPDLYQSQIGKRFPYDYDEILDLFNVSDNGDNSDADYDDYLDKKMIGD